MRRALFVLSGPALAALALFACDDTSSGGGGGQFTFDGGQFDGFVPITPDGSVPPAVDAEAAAPLPITVKVSRVTGPAVGLTVVWHDATGAVTGTALTDANGLAVSPVPAPAMATALLDVATGAPHAITWMGTKPGDVLLANDDDITNGVVGNLDVTMNQATPDGGIGFQARAGSCSSMGTMDRAEVLRISLDPECARSPGAVLALSGDEALTTVNGFSFAKNVAPVTDAGTVAVSTGAWLAPGTVTLNVLNVPEAGAPPTPMFHEVAGALLFPYFTGNVLDANGSASYKVAPGFADAYQYGIYEATANNGFIARRLLGKRSVPGPTVSLDYANHLPLLTGAEIDASVDGRRPKITWTSAASLATTDGASISFTWYTQGDDYAKAWTIVVPPDLAKNEIQAPALPADKSAWAPPVDVSDAGGNVTLDPPLVIFGESDSLASYDEFRAIAGLAVPPANGNADMLLNVRLPKNGTIRLTSVEALGR